MNAPKKYFQIPSSLDALLVTNPTNIRYLSGFIGVSPQEREAYLLLTRKEMYIFTSSLYLEQASKLPCEVIKISTEFPLSKKLASLFEKLHCKKIGFEDVNLTVAELTKLKSSVKNVSFLPARDVIEKAREIKRSDEIASIQKASQLTNDCFHFIVSKLKQGMKESDIAWDMETFFQKHEAQSAFSPIVAFNNNASMPHYFTGNTVLTPQSLILLDFGAKVNGYCSDMTRVVFLGRPKDEWVMAYAAVLDAQLTALHHLSKGVRSGKQLDAVAQKTIKKYGLPSYSHSLGHAVGLDIHESPRLSIKQDATLKPNMVVTIEPGVYKEGAYGIRIEDTVLIGNNDIEVLTTSSKEITVLK